MLRARPDAEALAEAAGDSIVGIAQVTVLPSASPRSMEDDVSRIAVRSAQAAMAETPIESGSLNIIVTPEVKFLF